MIKSRQKMDFAMLMNERIRQKYIPRHGKIKKILFSRQLDKTAIVFFVDGYEAIFYMKSGVLVRYHGNYDSLLKKFNVSAYDSRQKLKKMARGFIPVKAIPEYALPQGWGVVQKTKVTHDGEYIGIVYMKDMPNITESCLYVFEVAVYSNRVGKNILVATKDFCIDNPRYILNVFRHNFVRETSSEANMKALQLMRDVNKGVF